jgi:hypothetical protein
MSLGKPWVWVCVQHPMPLLVQDRGVPVVLERIPPWGDPDLASYVRKFHDVLDSVEKFPAFKLDFEISARELKDVSVADPSVIRRMKELVACGKLGFVGGDYSQSHCHVFGAESSLRQIARGLEVFQTILGYHVDVFFHQETGLHDQLPQLLAAHGYKVAVPPRFPYALEFSAGTAPELSSHFGSLEFIEGAGLTEWEGLDGTPMPLYLSMPAPSQSDEIIEVFRIYGNPDVARDRGEGSSPFERFAHREHQKVPVTVPRVLIENPDMKRISEEYYARRSAMCDFALMGDALAAEMARGGAVGRARIYAYWSYIEGVWAESLSRANVKAETNALQAESLAAMATAMTGEPPADLGPAWENILSSQHHDVYWIETTELKRQALGWLAEASELSRGVVARAAGSIAARVDTRRAAGSDTLVLFNTLPRTRFWDEGVAIELPRGKARSITVSTIAGRPVESQMIEGERWDDGTIRTAQLILRPEVPGLGYRALQARLSSESEPQQESFDRITLEGRDVRVTVNGDGTIPTIVHKQSGTQLIRAGALLGNELRYHDPATDTLVSSKRDGARGTCVRGPLADAVRVCGSLGKVGYTEDILVYHRRDRMDFRLLLDFGSEGMDVGSFWDDHTKLNVFWPLALDGRWSHNIPFGALPARSGRPLYCTSWIGLSDGELGVSYFNSGTTKHWVEDNVLANVLAWGGDNFSNRDAGLWEYVKKYDLRLRGTHVIEYSLCIHSGKRDAMPPHMIAEERANPLLALWDTTHAGTVPASHGLLAVDTRQLAVTSTRAGASPGSIICRMYEATGHELPASKMGATSPARKRTLAEIGGKRTKDVRPWKIVELTCEQ